MNNPIIILLVIVAVMALVALVSFIIYRTTHPKLKEEKPKEEEIVKEEMDRFLKPIEDEDLAKKINEYKEDDE